MRVGVLVSHRRAPLAKAVIVAVVCVIAAVILHFFSLDEKVVNSWPDYQYGNLEQRITQINLPAKLRAVMLVVSARDRQTLVGVEDHKRNWYFDDIGYMLFVQLFVLLFGEVTATGLAWSHNALFVCAMIAVAVEACVLLRSVLGGLAVFVGLGWVHHQLRPHIYGSVSTHSFIPVMAMIFVAVLLPAVALLGRKRWGLTLVSLGVASAISSAFLLIRSPVGLAFMLTLVGSLVIAALPWRRRISGLAAIVLGYVLVVHALPGTLAILRDRTVGWYSGFTFGYFRRPPAHAPNFTLLALVGRYPNRLGLVLQDSAVDKLLFSRFRERRREFKTEYDEAFERLARDELVAYVRRYPWEFFGHRLRGILEMRYVVPAITFQHGSFFAGLPTTTPTVESRVPEIDRHPGFRGGIVNLKLSYLDIGVPQWLAYLAATALIVAASAAAVRHGSRTDTRTVAFLSLLSMLSLTGGVRALIPLWGQDFVVAFWVTATLCFGFFVTKGMEWILGRYTPLKSVARGCPHAS